MAEYQDVTWSSDDAAVEDSLQQMTANDKYLFDHIMPQKYIAYNFIKTQGLKMACGIVSFNPSSPVQLTKDVMFGSFFTPGSRPVVVASLATPQTFRAFIIIKGFGEGNQRPDSNGFNVVLNADPLKAGATGNWPGLNHVHWIAIGY